ncbi:microtubule organizing protein mora [Volvox carteri f. nagariensis]|uniref:Microtubule organizing protein mora n=1 Tax=Volvox carteri f. nagariensis TaxID=3068 RepID=D8U7I8_VOLCA|nr:microtubule organizing protein mora [Volvox carteri f. nagariensis]EFJ44246.1 microtubule organizing protein mora [Volvox carteri f. nagariensis]|eukprot:XP_002954605.1 microtubule organizing protein mora [Volvox carteri f. nagariensis]
MSDDKDVRELAEAKKLPLPDRIAHSNWKARVAAYEDISAACREIYDDADPRLSEFAPLFPKAVTEANAAAVDKALDALVVFLTKATEQHASRICEKTCSNIVAKCLSARTSTLTRALDAMLLFIELEQAEKVTEALVSGLGNKNPKVVVASLEFLYHGLNLFGHRVVAPQPMIKALPALFESKDGKARDKVKDLVMELARWLGPDAVRTMLFEKMREVMRDELNRNLEGLELSRKPPRLTRKQQAKAADAREQAPVGNGATSNGGAAAAAAEDEPPPEADPYDFVDPKKVLSELKSDSFWDKLEEKKWTERRDAVLLLKGLADTPRIASGDYGDLMRELRKLISKDSNVVVVAESINCCGLLAKGLRKEFASWARNLAGLLLEKFKEKNSNVGNAVAGALTFMHKYCWSLTEVVEDFTEAMGHANPKVKEDTYKWLTGAVPQEPKANLKQLVAPLMGAAAKGAEEATPALREAAMGFMAAFTVRFGNTAILEKFGAKLDDARKKKLQAARTPGPTLSMKSRLGATVRPAAASKPASAAPGGGGGPSAGAGGGAGAGKKAASGGDGDDEASLASGSLSRDQAVQALTDLVGEATVKELQDEQWKVRLDAMERLVAFVGEPGVAAANGSTIVQSVSHVPGWAEKNFQVMAKVLEALRVTATGCPSFSKRDAFTCIGGIIDKVADLKLKQPSFDTLTSFAEAVGPQFIMTQLHKKAAAHKNPKVQSEAINWIGRAILEFGLAGMDVRALLDWAKEDLGSANAGVRNSSIQLLGIMYRFLGPALGDMIRADVKPALMTAIDGEFAKNADLPKPEPTRVSRVATTARGGAAGAKGGAKGGGGGNAGAAAGELITQLGSSNWKERKAGLDAIETILTQAGNRIQPQTGDLLPELKKRMADSNKNLTTQALTVLGRIAKAMGKAIDRQGRPLLTPAIKNITDQKQTVRSAVTEMLDAWVGVTSASCVMPDVMDFYISSKITADGKAETLKWMASLASGAKISDCLVDILRAGGMGSTDKAAEVRDAASKLMIALVETIGAAELGAAAQTLDVATRKPAMDAISKVTGAPVPVAAVAAFGSAAAAPSAKPAATRSSKDMLRASTASGIARPGGLNSTMSRPGTAKTSGVAKSMHGSSMGAMAAADAGPLLMPDNRKEDRAKKGRFRPAKLQIMPDEAVTLEAEFSPMLSPALRAAAFSKDFKKHCEAADMLIKALPVVYDEVIAIVDLLFRWSTLRILESNTASLVKVLDMLKLLLDLMIDRGYRISEYEAKLILPAVVEKSGHNQDKLKAEHRELLKRFAQVHPPVKVVTYVKDGLESKNSKTRVVCLDEIAAIVERTGPVVDSLMAAVARLVAERDTAVRAACLGVMEVLYCIEGQGMWDYVGRLTDQQKSLIEERIKAVGNRLVRAGHQPGYKAAEYGLPVQPSTTAGVASPAARGSLMDSFSGRGALATSMAAVPPPANSDSPPPVQAAPEGYDVRRVNSPAISRFGSFNMGAVPVSGGDSAVLTSLEGPDEEATMRNWVIMHDRLQGDDWEGATQAMKLLCYSYMELDKHSPHVVSLLMDPRNADELVHLLSQRIEQSLSDAAASTMCLPGGPIYNARACKYSVNSLMNLCNVTPLTTSLTDSALRRLCSVLIACLIDGRLRQVPDGDGLLKAVNMLIMKLLEHANRAGLFGGFIHCLRVPNPRIYEMAHPATAGSDGGEAEMLLRWNDMLVKCLIKMTKQLGALVPSLNVGNVLVHIHRYMQDLGTEEVRRRSSNEDKPLRMVKTMLHELCKHRGYDIYKDVEAMPGVQETMEEMVMLPYIRLNLETLQRAGQNLPGSAAAATLMAAAAAPRPAMAPNADVASTSGSAAAGAPRSRGIPYATPASTAAASATGGNVSPLSLEPSSHEFKRPVLDDQEARNVLATIFKRIGDKAQSQQALVDLHHFIDANPNIDVLNQMLSQVSPYFKQFLQRGLSKVRLQLQHAASTAAAATAQEHASGSPAAAAKLSDGGGANSGGGSSWGTLDGDSAGPLSSRMTLADKLAASEARPHSPASPGRLRGVGNLDELRSRMNSLSTNLHDLPVRNSASISVPGGVSQDLLDLQERMKKIQSIAAAAGPSS